MRLVRVCESERAVIAKHQPNSPRATVFRWVLLATWLLAVTVTPGRAAACPNPIFNEPFVAIVEVPAADVPPTFPGSGTFYASGKGGCGAAHRGLWKEVRRVEWPYWAGVGLKTSAPFVLLLCLGLFVTRKRWPVLWRAHNLDPLPVAAAVWLLGQAILLFTEPTVNFCPGRELVPIGYAGIAVATLAALAARVVLGRTGHPRVGAMLATILVAVGGYLLLERGHAVPDDGCDRTMPYVPELLF